MMSASKIINKIVKRLSLTFSGEFAYLFSSSMYVCCFFCFVFFFFYDFNNSVCFEFL